MCSSGSVRGWYKEAFMSILSNWTMGRQWIRWPILSLGGKSHHARSVLRVSGMDHSFLTKSGWRQFPRELQNYFRCYEHFVVGARKSFFIVTGFPARLLVTTMPCAAVANQRNRLRDSNSKFAARCSCRSIFATISDTHCSDSDGWRRSTARYRRGRRADQCSGALAASDGGPSKGILILRSEPPLGGDDNRLPGVRERRSNQA